MELSPEMVERMVVNVATTNTHLVLIRSQLEKLEELPAKVSALDSKIDALKESHDKRLNQVEATVADNTKFRDRIVGGWWLAVKVAATFATITTLVIACNR